jgi:hypothetical protein
MPETAYFASAIRVVLDLFMIGTKTQRNNKYMLSGKIVQYGLGILLYVFQWDRHLLCLQALRIFSLGKTVTQPAGSINIFIGKDSYTSFREYKHFHSEGQLHSLEVL